MGSPYTDYRDAPGVGLGSLEFDRVLAFTFVTKSIASNLRCQCRLASNLLQSGDEDQGQQPFGAGPPISRASDPPRKKSDHGE